MAAHVGKFSTSSWHREVDRFAVLDENTKRHLDPARGQLDRREALSMSKGGPFSADAQQLAWHRRESKGFCFLLFEDNHLLTCGRPDCWPDPGLAGRRCVERTGCSRLCMSSSASDLTSPQTLCQVNLDPTNPRPQGSGCERWYFLRQHMHAYAMQATMTRRPAAHEAKQR